MKILIVILIFILVIFIAFVLYQFKSHLVNGSAERSSSHPQHLTRPIIHILGPQGSGKSHLLNQVKNEHNFVIDTDDVMVESYRNIKDTSIYQKQLEKLEELKIWEKEKDKILTKLIEENKDKTIIIAGITAAIPKRFRVQGYILSPKNEEEFENWFRRASIRDLNKLCDNRDKILEIIKSSNVKNIGFDTEMGLHGLGLSIPPHFILYKDNFENMLRIEKKYERITFDDLLKKLKAI
jgi:hypothetical protein